ncbi:photosynthetic complex putative assembly protein PuhB [Sphingomonas sp. GlSt437]|uniref:photosynthetic complex putative assembly protein PuhB n=1 Tax=Sphingomonas sp. GlSt437 TaxID=3389970 RepID=UPI003A85B5A9
MITEYEAEPIPGLPGLPPKGEHILWQGSPDWRVLARTAFHARMVGGYFAVLTGLAAIMAIRSGNVTGLAITACLGVVVTALLTGLAWWASRGTIYTLTNRRIVLRFGMALPKCVNLPLALVQSIDLHAHHDGSGDVSIAISGRQAIGYMMLWPHARPWRLATPEPMLRAVPDAAKIADRLAQACRAVAPEGTTMAVSAAPARLTPQPQAALA